ncbi:hypothetical protein QZR43_04825 [Serratia marcescens]|uniref:hypothetical protein n=1 Tax=Serratia marcescens TaxID=615 RepID=UPI0027668B0E|nr:hypothetical protein [Serratia marcescens]MDP8771910.1 hypothetical protein [Serratia marcescens]MDP8802314.1 hypothetical protein [Serratia marcescens]
MVSNDNLMLEGMKILIDGYDHKGEKSECINEVSDSLINFLCAKGYFYATGTYNDDEVNEQSECLKKAIFKYKNIH